MAKQEFYFVQDIKITVWNRRKFTVEAESEEEAIELLRKNKTEDVYFIMDEGHPVYVYDNEYILDTEEIVTPEENGGCSTIEWYRLGETHKEPLFTNTDK